jgi:hypothetical protein
MSNLRFKLWWVRDTTTLLTTQTQVRSHTLPCTICSLYIFCVGVFYIYFITSACFNADLNKVQIATNTNFQAKVKSKVEAQ